MIAFPIPSRTTVTIPPKRRQIETAENYRATHCGCTLHNACLRSFVRVKGGYKSGKALYRVMLRTAKDNT